MPSTPAPPREPAPGKPLEFSLRGPVSAGMDDPGTPPPAVVGRLSSVHSHTKRLRGDHGGHGVRIPLTSRILANRGCSGAYPIMLALATAMFGILFFVSILVQNVLGCSALRSGVTFLSLAGTIVVVHGIVGQRRCQAQTTSRTQSPPALSRQSRPIVTRQRNRPPPTARQSR
jgi:hypothetical protein